MRRRDTRSAAPSLRMIFSTPCAKSADAIAPQGIARMRRCGLHSGSTSRLKAEATM